MQRHERQNESNGSCVDRSYSVRTSRTETYSVVCRSGILSLGDRTLASVLRCDSPVLVVLTPSVDHLYGHRLRQYVSAHCPSGAVSFMVVACSETRKSMEQVLAVCERASQAGLARRSQIVCVGGGVSLDIVGLAATLFRRGISQIRVPTTLIGMIDAGIGVKNAVNFTGTKSLLGTFAAPEACIIDPSFLATLPRRHLQCGLAEMIKIAVMCSPGLFVRIEERSKQLLGDVCGMPSELSADLIQLSVQWTLTELEKNLFERSELFQGTYARKLDFGHTFSPYIEVASDHRVLHGEAVAIDMAICAILARRLGILDEASCNRLVGLLLRLGLPIYCHGLDSAAMYGSLQSIVQHRDGNLNLALPIGIGHATFMKELSQVSAALLDEAWQLLFRLSSMAATHSDAPRAEMNSKVSGASGTLEQAR
jgi:2-epi-5-epi-valiolone synthase